MTTPEKPLEDAGYGKGEIALAAAELPNRFKSAAHPPLPTVGRIVHFYHRELPPVGPHAAIVSAVHTQSTSSNETVAEIDLHVAVLSSLGNATGHCWQVHTDVPGVQAGVKHDYQSWWQWPERS